MPSLDDPLMRRRRRASPHWLLFAILLIVPADAASQGPAPLSGIGFDEILSGPPVLAEAFGAARTGELPSPAIVRLTLAREEIEPQPGVHAFDALDARLATYRQVPGVRVYLDLRAAIPPPDAQAEWSRLLRTSALRYRGQVAGWVIGVLPPGVDRPSAEAFAFHIKSTVVALRTGDDDATIVLGGIGDADRDWLDALYAEDIASYLDAIGLEPGSSPDVVPPLVERHDPTAGVALFGEALGDEATAATRRILDRQFEVLGTRITAVTFAARAAMVTAALPALATLREMLGQPLVTLDAAAVGVRLLRDGADVTGVVPHRLVFGLRSATSYFVYPGTAGPLELRLSDPAGTRPVVVDALAVRRVPVDAFAHDPSSSVSTLGLPGGSGPLVVDWNTTDRQVYTDSSEVSTAVLPSLAEIISRHQVAQAGQDAVVTTYTADAVMEQHFRATAADLAFDVVTENTFYVEGGQTEFEERSFRLNGTRWGADRPPFPLLQAEKVLSLPLDLRLTSDYRYRLEGIEAVDGREAFVIRFDPVDQDRALYRGTVWIDRATWLKVRVQTIQTDLAAPVLSSEEIQRFAPVGTVDGRTVMLLTELIGRQSLLIAGRNLLLERQVLFDTFRINPEDFEARRAAARASDHVMYRDTDEGLRYLVRRDGVRVVETGTTSSATALLIGVLYDPGYDFPLPLGGLNYLDFEFLGKGNQLAVTFGGVLALVNLQRPNLIGKTVDGSLDLFAIAVPGSDRVYGVDGERSGERLRTLPFSTGANVGWRFAGFNRLVASYQFRFDKFSAEDTTAEDFGVPASTVTNGLGLSWEWKRHAYSFTAGWTGYRRARWVPWGGPDLASLDDDRAHRDYAKYSLSATKAFFTGVHKVSINAAYYGGRDLDRFSQYQFGLFDEHRVRGVPSAGVRFAELGMLRGAYSFNLLDVYRVDLFLDQALGRDRRVDPGWDPVTGVGVAFSMRGPRNTMVRGDVGKSFLPSRYRKPGSLVFQIQVLKPL